jgi:cation:H+ antiporter
MSALVPWLLVAAGLFLLFYGGEFLVKGAARLALRLGITPLVVGLTVVAFGTSCPELFVSIRAALEGQGDIAIGNIVGSNISNIGLILALCAAVYPLKVAVQILRFDMPVLLGVSTVFLLMLLDGALSRIEGLALVVGLLVYLVVVVRMSRKEHRPEVDAEFAEGVPKPDGGAWKEPAFILAGLVALAFGARFLIDGASTLARAFGLSEAVIGLTIVSVGTSLPELSTSLVAAFRKEGDIAVGNVVGSNLFNILCIGGLSGALVPFSSPGVGLVDFGVMMAFTIVLLPLMRTGFTIRRWEGLVLVAAYVGYIAWLLAKDQSA